MLKAVHAGTGHFTGAHGIGNVPFERNFLFAGFLRNREDGFAGNKRLQLDEIRATLLQLDDRASPVFRSRHSDRAGEARLRAIEHGSRSHDARTQQSPALDVIPPGLDNLQFAAHISHTGNAIRDEQRQRNFLGPRKPVAKHQVDMHVPQARDEKTAFTVQDRGSVTGVARILSRADRGDAVLFDNDDLVRANLSRADIDDVDVGDDDSVLKRPVLSLGGSRNEEKKNDDGRK